MQLVGRGGTGTAATRGRKTCPLTVEKPVENRPVPIVIAVAIGVFGLHAAVASGGGYLNYVSGIWLALANDLQHGVFYRELMTEDGYGGTRYFPLFFVVIGAFMRLGASALVAGWLASALTAIVLTSGMYAAVRGLGGTRTIAGLFAACAISSVLHSANALRSARGRPCRGAECVGTRVSAEGMGASRPAAAPNPP